MPKVTRLFQFVCVVYVLITFVSVAPAQKRDVVAETLGLNKANNALPIWSKADDQTKADLGKIARRYLQGVMLVGHPDVGHGTAWVISKKHRLLATNAHVADLMAKGKQAMAITNETSNIYKVEKAWYHPGVRRYFEGSGSLSILSSDPEDGPVFPSCPDLAVLQLSSDGPDLPVEFTMATRNEVESVLGNPAAIFGFPGHDTDWPSLGQSPIATLHDGIVSRVTDFFNSTRSERQQLQYTMSTWGGYSGSPLILSNGHVVGVHNMARTVESGSGVIRSIPHGVRIDCLWELLVHHGLDDKVAAKFDKSKLDIERWLKKDKRDEIAVRVRQLVDEAHYLLWRDKEYAKAGDKCTEAIKLAPDYGRAYEKRSDVYARYYFKYYKKLSYKSGLQQVERALRDAIKFAQLEPNNPDAIETVCLAYDNLGYHTEKDSFNQKAYSLADQLLSADSLTNYQRATAHCRRASALSNLGEYDSALRDYNEAIRLSPSESSFYGNRGAFFEAWGHRSRAAADRQKAKELLSKKYQE